MKNPLVILPLFLGVLCCWSCGQHTTTSPREVSSDTLKAASELTYLEIYLLAFGDDKGDGMDFHGESFGLEASAEIEIMDGPTCAKQDCGKVQMLRNLSEKSTLEVAIRASFDIPNNPIREIYRYYLLPADSALSVGCSTICYDGQTYPVQREINSAGFKTNGD